MYVGDDLAVAHRRGVTNWDSAKTIGIVFEHVCFVASALLFWYPVVRPYPSRPKWSRWLLFPYLLLADVQNTLLAAWLSFSSAVLYPHYSQVPRLGGISALDDQADGWRADVGAGLDRISRPAVLDWHRLSVRLAT